MRKKLIIINGVMGVGKTTISKALLKSLDNCFWLDGDNCWMMNPFVVNEENKDMVLNNIGYIINSFINNSSSKYILFNWVIHEEEIMRDVLSRISLKNVDVYKVTLMCTKEDLVKRIKKDIENGIRDEKNIDRSLEKYNLYKSMDTIKIDTTDRNVDEIVNEIKALLI